MFGLALLPLLLLQPTLQADQLSFRRPLIGAIYSVVCIVGIAAVFYPSKCSMALEKPNVSSPSKSLSAPSVQMKGHHPDCEDFMANRITIKGKAFCASCSGLLIGAIVAMAATILFSLGFIDLGAGGFWVLLVGEVLMLMGLAQIKAAGCIKMAVNALFVVGSCLILVVADSAGQNLLIDGYVLGLIVFMLWFRILLSEWNNKRTCMRCGRCF